MSALGAAVAIFCFREITMIYRFDILSSTNDEACNPQYKQGDIIVAESQSAGRGQRGHTWESGKGLNLTFSAVLEPTFLPPTEQFLLSEVIALAVADTLASYSIETKIKWTNDIYVGDKKIAGILIEHKLQGNTIGRTIAGIGLNVNQTLFSADLPNPTSMAKEQGTEFDRDEVLKRLQECIMKRYAQLQNGERETLQSDYHSMLYRLNEQHCYALPDGSRVQGIIRGVEPTGALKVEDEKGEIRSYLFKEIEFVLKN